MQSIIPTVKIYAKEFANNTEKSAKAFLYSSMRNLSFLEHFCRGVTVTFLLFLIV